MTSPYARNSIRLYALASLLDYDEARHRNRRRPENEGARRPIRVAAKGMARVHRVVGDRMVTRRQRGVNVGRSLEAG